MSGETTIQTDLKTTLLTMSEFDAGDVVIDDWTILDQPTTNAPYALIRTADDFRWREDSMDGEHRTWSILVGLYVAFSEWGVSRAVFRDLRQAVLDKFAGDNSALTGDNVLIQEIRNAGPIGEVYDVYIAPEELPEATPIMLFQDLTFEVREVIC